jgi:hypothetical protein
LVIRIFFRDTLKSSHRGSSIASDKRLSAGRELSLYIEGTAGDQEEQKADAPVVNASHL